ncbi:MAG: YkgJ family cysteine cluster protein [gamma proteobacterium symbiont of Bathyaustriella thionipta]|nr:YkgJ family cysteine cluster protein [gamma proteobacterium symbiont of Bathyaustriella thionipta]
MAARDNKCQRCHASICCNYFTQALDTPRSKADFELLLWQISHQHAEIYKDSDGWFLLINSTCLHLQQDGTCGIYTQRPQICRDYSNDYCEFDAPATDGFDLYFKNYASLLDYCRQRFKTWGR